MFLFFPKKPACLFFNAVGPRFFQPTYRSRTRLPVPPGSRKSRVQEEEGPGTFIPLGGAGLSDLAALMQISFFLETGTCWTHISFPVIISCYLSLTHFTRVALFWLIKAPRGSRRESTLTPLRNRRPWPSRGKKREKYWTYWHNILLCSTTVPFHLPLFSLSGRKTSHNVAGSCRENRHRLRGLESKRPPTVLWMLRRLLSTGAKYFDYLSL